MNKIKLLQLAIVTLLIFKTQLVVAGGITLGYTSGPAKTDDKTLFEDPAGYTLFIGNQSDHLLGFEFAIFGIVENPEIKDKGLGGMSLTGTILIPMGFVSLFARAGVADWALFENDVLVDEGTSATYGAGLSFHFSDNWGLKLEQQRYTDIGPNKADIIQNRFGFVFTFD